MRIFAPILFLWFLLPVLAQEFTGRVVKNMAELRALTPSTFKPMVQTLGYYAPGDGGGGFYVVTNTTSATNAYGGRVLALGGAKSWELIDTVYNAKQFGAKGDGVANDALTLQAWLSYTSGKQAILPDGTYRIVPYVGMPEFSAFLGSTLTNYPFILSGTNISIVGSGRFASTIVVDRNGYTNTVGAIKITGTADISKIGIEFPFTVGYRNIAGISFTGYESGENSISFKDCRVVGGYHLVSLFDFIENTEVSGNILETIRYTGNGADYQTGAYGIATVDPHVFRNVFLNNNVITNITSITGADAILVNVDNVSNTLIDDSYTTNIANVEINGNSIYNFTGNTSSAVQGGIDVAGPILGLRIIGNSIRNTKNAIWHEWLVSRDPPGRLAPIATVISDNIIEFTHRGISFDYQNTDERTSSIGYTNTQDKQVIITGNIVEASTNNFNGFQWGIVGSGNAVITGNKSIGIASPDPSEYVSGSFYSSGFFYRGGGNMIVSDNEFRGWQSGFTIVSTQPVGSVVVEGNLFKYNNASYTIDEGSGGPFRALYSISGNKHDGNKSIFYSPGASILRVDDEYVVGDIKVDVAYLKGGSFGGYGIDQVNGQAHAYTASGSGFEYYRHLGVFAGQEMYGAGTPPRYTTMSGNFSSDNFYMSTNVYRWEFQAVAGNPYIQATGTTNWPNMFRPGTFVQLFDTTTGETHFYTNTMIIACDPANSRFYLSTNCPTNAVGWLLFPTVTLDGGRKVDGTLEVTTGNIVASNGQIASYAPAGNAFLLSSETSTNDVFIRFANQSTNNWLFGTLGVGRNLVLYDTNGAARTQWGNTSGLTIRDPVTITGNIGTSNGRLNTTTAGANVTILGTSTGGDSIAVQYWNTSTNWWNFFMNGTSKDLIWYDRSGADRLTLTQGGTEKVQTSISASAAYDPPSIASLASATTTVTVTGAVLGWRALATQSTLTTQGLILYAHASSADTVTVVIFNPTGAPVDLGNGTLAVTAFKP